MIIHRVGIGEIKRAARGEQLAAVLGSCVSVIVWHRASGFALMNHVLLPRRLSESAGENPGRYADESWWLMEGMLRKKGVALRDCLSHLVGGGCGVDAPTTGGIGFDNVATAFDLLVDADAKIESIDTGGRCYRSVRFDTESGELLVARHRAMPVVTPAFDSASKARRRAVGESS
jgi:chemotaxis protein CheD